MSHPFSWQEWQAMDAVDLAARVQRAEVTPAEVAAQAAAAIELLNPCLDAVLEVFDDAVDDPAGSGAAPHGLLYGVPMLVKDSGSAMAGRLREWGSRLTLGQRPANDCPLTTRLREAGLNLLGRTTLPESGKTFDTTTDYLGRLLVTRNPWDLSRTPGGSSGGSAAIVASGAVPLARAGDAAGSTRVPASFTGLIGLKPSRGLLPPPRGTNELTNHRIQEGVLTRTVRDQAALLDVMVRPGKWGHYISATCSPTAHAEQVRQPPPRLRVAVSTGSWGLPGGCDRRIAERISELAALLDDLGHHVDETDANRICNWEAFWGAARTNWVATSWFWRSIAGQRGWPLERVRDQLTPQNANLLDAGAHLTVADVHVALAGNPRLMAELETFFGSHDILLCPAFPDLPPLANGPFSLFDGAPFESWFTNLLHGMRYTVLGNESGLPSLSLPAGLLEGLPIGALLYGPPLSDGTLLQIAAEIEAARPAWFAAVPAVSMLSVSRQQRVR